MAHITEVSYRETKTFGDYQNATVEMVASVNAGELAEQVLEILKGKVRDELARRESENDRLRKSEIEHRDLEWKLSDLRRDIAEQERKLDVLRERWAVAQEFLEKHGLNAIVDDENMPF